jgi:O-antigen ligase
MEAVDPARAATFASITIYLIVFALWIASWTRDRRRARTLLRIYLLVATVSAALGSIALFVPIPGHDLLTAYTGTRARAFFKDPNVFGPFLVPAALALVQELLRPQLLRSNRRVKLAMLATLVVGILLSYSRAAWLNFVVGAVVMGVVFSLRRGGSRQAFVFAGLMAVAVATVAAAVSLTGQLSFLQERARLQTYDSQRFAAQSAGLQLGERHPIGVGPGQFELYEPISAHSTYVRALAEEGPLGFLVLAGIMFGTLLLALRNAARGWDTHGIASTVLLAAWCGILANSVFIDTLHWRHLWLIAGLIWCAAAAQTSSYAGARSPM